MHARLLGPLSCLGSFIAVMELINMEIRKRNFEASYQHVDSVQTIGWLTVRTKYTPDTCTNNSSLKLAYTLKLKDRRKKVRNVKMDFFIYHNTTFFKNNERTISLVSLQMAPATIQTCQLIAPICAAFLGVAIALALPDVVIFYGYFLLLVLVLLSFSLAEAQTAVRFVHLC